ncbi:TetR/AcrR family transcriptional regulator [Saccharopolyspora sp. NPDC050389]|uniref:TetR/AcrR family transcriptional regulator n=1 Tax=Saccharopolyspora sp. NPDC050389 TaxID=3155516 RepID=UPI0033F56281
MSDDPTPNGIPERLIEATTTLLAEQGPSAIKARTVAAEAGMSTMVVYNYFGGIPELIGAVVDHGFADIERTFAALPATDDPVADLFRMALAVRDIARANPHLYDAMFGLSTRATYRPSSAKGVRRSGHSPAFKAAYAHVVEACARIAASDRVEMDDPTAVASALWSYVHGYITLELADHFTEFDDPVAQVLVPMGVTFTVGLGDDPARARASHEAALTSHQSSTTRDN